MFASESILPPAFPARPSALARSLAFACGIVVSAAAAPAFDAASTRAAPRGSGSANIVVANCNDDGPGSLREAVDDLAASGDTIDLSQLSCSTITLSTGAITTSLDDLSFVGSQAGIGISGSDQFPVVTHLGAGTLGLHHVQIVHGYRYDDVYAVRGGCIHSQGSVFLNDITVAYCVAKSPVAAAGGGVYASNGLSMLDSIITGTSALTSSGAAQGGGAMVGGFLSVKYSALTNNVAQADAGPGSSTCGAASAANASVIGSSIVGNAADYFGGFCANDANAPLPLSVRNSTITDNESLGAAPSTGGTGLNAKGALTLANSTVAYNRQVASGSSVGVYVRVSANIDSSIIASNTAGNGTQASDLGGDPSATVAGSHNLIRASTLALPADTLDVDPQLGEIQVYPGGRPTAYVRPPLPGSPTIDAGSNPFDLDFDQRGAPNPRVAGAAADIGAVEIDADRIFTDGFD